MPPTPVTVPPAAARSLLLRGLGLLADPARRASPARTRREIERLGFVQVDTIQVAERAHHHILMTRLDGYRPPMLRRLLERDRSCFEHWTHDAAILPTALLPQWQARFAWMRGRIRQRDTYYRQVLGGEPERVMAAVLERLHREGPLSSSDFEAPPADQKRHAWFGRRKPGKTALEMLWRCGEAAIAHRDNFKKVYDVFDRVLPRPEERDAPDPAALAAWSAGAALERLGVGTPAELAHHFDIAPVADVRAWCRDAATRGEIVEVLADSAAGDRPRPAYAHRAWRRRAAVAAAGPARMRLLSPFEPAIRDRDRTRRVFGFDYRFEGFVPPAQRRFGYYVMPLLEGDRLVGRLDPKFHRDAGRLSVQRLWWEPGVSVTRARRRALEDAVARYAEQIGAAEWRFERAPLRALRG